MTEYLEPIWYNEGKVDWTLLPWSNDMLLELQLDTQDVLDMDKIDFVKEILSNLFTKNIWGVLVKSLSLYQQYDYKGKTSEESIYIELPYNALEQVCRVFMYAVETKYPRDNYKLAPGLPLESYIQSMWRHLVQYLRGEEVDIESKLSHLSHLACNCFMYLWTKKEYHNEKA